MDSRKTQPFMRRAASDARSVAVAMLLAAALIGCAPAPGMVADDPPGSGSSVPAQINYQGFPYDIQAGDG